MLTDPENKNKCEYSTIKSFMGRFALSPIGENREMGVSRRYCGDSEVEWMLIGTHTVINTDKGTRYAY